MHNTFLPNRPNHSLISGLYFFHPKRLVPQLPGIDYTLAMGYHSAYAFQCSTDRKQVSKTLQRSVLHQRCPARLFLHTAQGQPSARWLSVSSYSAFFVPASLSKNESYLSVKSSDVLHLSWISPFAACQIDMLWFYSLHLCEWRILKML